MNKLKFDNFNGASEMKQLLTFQGLPMVIVTGMVIWSWISILSVVLASFF